MTRKTVSSKEFDKAESALKALYGSAGRDLTYEGYSDRISRLRAADPALARRVERALAPMLEDTAFPRRRRRWQDTSAGTKTRLFLLDGNPHFETDVDTVRNLAMIPDDQIRATPADPVWQELSGLGKAQSMRGVIEGAQASRWHYIHTEAAMGRTVPYEETDGLITTSLHESASRAAKVNLADPSSPSWLRLPPKGPGPYVPGTTPLDWATGRLMERHRLPWHVAVNVTFYILTKNRKFITGLEPMVSSIMYGSNDSDPDSFAVSVKGIDEFTSKADWDRIWQTLVRPGQERLWHARGMKPIGRNAPDQVRLRRFLPLYQDMARGHITVAEAIGKAKLNESRSELLDEADQETVRRALRDIESLLQPGLGIATHDNKELHKAKRPPASVACRPKRCQFTSI